MILKVSDRERSNGFLKGCNVWTTALEEIFNDGLVMKCSKTEPVFYIQRMVLPPFEEDLVDEEVKVG